MNQSLSILFSSIILAALSTGCFYTSEVDRGSLSDAMDKASDENEGDRKTEEFAIREEEAEVVVDAPVAPSTVSRDPHKPLPDSLQAQRDAQEIVQHTPPSESSWLGFMLGSGALASSDLYGLRSGGITFGGYLDRTGYLEISLAFANAPVQQTSKLSHSLRGGINILGIGADLHGSFTPPHTFIGITYFGGVTLDIMWWSYRNAIQAPTYGGYEEIDSDAVSGVDVHAGIAVTFWQLGATRLTFELVPGINFWAFDTFEGFDNDIFSPLPYVAFKTKIALNISGW